jgi:hypothetical protein
MVETVETPLAILIIIWKNREIVKQQIDQRVSHLHAPIHSLLTIGHIRRFLFFDQR